MDFTHVGFSYMDIIVAAIVLVFAAMGFRKGFVREVVGILSLGASFVLAWVLYPVVSDLLVVVGLKGVVFEKIQGSVGEYMNGTGDLSGIPVFLREAAESGMQAAVQSASENATVIILNILSFVIVLILARIIIWIAQKLLIVLAEMPVISFFNRLAGMVFGFLQGGLVVLLLFALIYGIIPLQENKSLNNAMEQSMFAGEIYKENPIIKIFVSEKTEEAKTEETEETKTEEIVNGE